MAQIARLLTIFAIIIPNCLSMNILSAIEIDSEPPDFVDGCTMDDFDDGAECTMSCTVLLYDGYHPTSCSWKYYTYDSTAYVNIYDEITTSNDIPEDGLFSLNLTLSNYYSGTYTCEINVVDMVENERTYTYDFRVAPFLGVDLGGRCISSTDCNALNSMCTNNDGSGLACQCSGEYDINCMEESTKAPACLKHEDEGGNCNIDAECQATNEDYTCSSTLCTCSGQKVPVVEEDNKMMCLDPVYLMSVCAYDEQCLLQSENSVCKNNKCDCTDGYTMNMDGTPDQFYCSIKQPVVETCTYDDFDAGTGCTMSCTVDLSDGYNPTSCAWKYYTYESDEYVIIYDGVTTTNDNPEVFSLNLTLSTYYSGTYTCEIALTDTTGQEKNYTSDFRVATFLGVDLGGRCISSTDCNALNSMCTNNDGSGLACQCSGEYDINCMEGSTKAPACLKHEDEGSHCNIDEECQATNEDYTCSDTLCTCSGVKVSVAEENNEMMCLDPAYLMSICVYDEQCLLQSENSDCIDDMCDCADGYTMNMDGTPDQYYCFATPTTDTPTTEPPTTEPPTTEPPTTEPPTTEPPTTEPPTTDTPTTEPPTTEPPTTDTPTTEPPTTEPPTTEPPTTEPPTTDTPTTEPPTTQTLTTEAVTTNGVTSTSTSISSSTASAKTDTGSTATAEVSTTTLPPDDDDLSGGAIAGIVIASVAGVCIVGGVVFYFVKK